MTTLKVQRARIPLTWGEIAIRAILVLALVGSAAAIALAGCEGI